jgi:uncharacterized protein YajQ (UPF0234 family)
MNIQQIIDNRKSLTEEQMVSLRGLLTFRQREQTKRNLDSKLKYSFYTVFDGKDYSKQISFDNGIASYSGKDLKKVINDILEIK